MQSKLLETLTSAVSQYEAEQDEKVAELKRRVELLERQKADLQTALEQSEQNSFLFTDETLQKRLGKLGSPPLDTLMREACVLLEERLRRFAPEDCASRHGVNLVDAVLAPGTGPLQFSKHKGEQEGVRMLYRGAMQFIRNPPMHRIIDYEQGTAEVLLRLVDSLLQILAQQGRPAEEAVTIDDVLHMLRRLPIPQGQLDFYRVLGRSSKKTLSSAEIANSIGRSRQQLAGILGALGLRINGTDGLREKGGVEAVLEIQPLKDGWQYRMRPVLRKALEEEGIL